MRSYRRSSVLAALALLLSVSAGCSGESAAAAATTTTAAVPAASTTTTSAAAAATAPPETTTAAAEDVPETTTSAPPETSGKENENRLTLLATLPDGTKIFRENCEVVQEFDFGGKLLHSGQALVRRSTGFFSDSETNPDDFNMEDFEYYGETPEFGEMFLTEKGDAYGDNEVTDAFVELYVNEGDPTYIARECVSLSGELTLTGVVRYYCDIEYGVDSGDMIFIPDSCYAGLPMVVSPYFTGNIDEYHFWTTDFNVSDEGELREGAAVTADTPRLRIGNYYYNYSDNAAVKDFLGSADRNMTFFAEVTLTDINLEWNDNIGSYNTAVIKDIKRL